MTLRASAVLTFTGYEVFPAQPNAVPPLPVTVALTFVCGDPGPSMSATYTITATETELTLALTNADLKALLVDKLKAQFKPVSANATRLDGLIGQTVTV